MAKMKRVSVNEFEKMVKDLGSNFEEVEYKGLSFIVTNTISLKDMMSLVDEVSNNCFMSDGSFRPEVVQPLLDCGVVERYTNLTLPKNLESRYELVARSGVVEFIMTKINTAQYNDIVVAVRDKIDYMCDVNTLAFNNAIESMTSMMSNIQTGMAGLVEQYGVNDGRSIEERIVDAYRKKVDV
jgi:hypothetical protein